MHDKNVARPDLNLLVVFDAVTQAGTVTGAARRLRLTQPAVSHALNRLRDLLNDPLFVRTKQGLVPTPRAAVMAEPVRGILDAVEKVMAADAFDPATGTRTFRIAASDYSMFMVVPQLARRFRDCAPNALLEVTLVGDTTLALLDGGHLDFSFWALPSPGAPYVVQDLFEERLIGMMCASHPLVPKVRDGTFDLDDYLACPHVGIILWRPGHSPVDTALSKLGLSRRIAFFSGSFTADIMAVKKTDLLITLPSRFALADSVAGLVSFGLPLVAPRFRYKAIWHQRSDGDPGLVWLRSLLSDVTSEISSIL